MGALGDLTAWLESKKRVARRNIEDIVARPRDWEKMAAARWKQDLREQMKNPESGLDFVGGPLGSLAGVIKNKGGNWLKGTVEEFVGPLKRYAPQSDIDLFAQRIAERQADIARLERNRDEILPLLPPERKEAILAYLPDTIEKERRAMAAHQDELNQLNQRAAINKWIEGPLTKYMKTQMATPEDPVRALAEQGILHYAPDYEFASRGTMHAREAAGFPRHGMAKSDLARGWEADSDMMIEPIPVEFFRDSDMKAYDFREPWMDKLPEGTPVYNALEREEMAGFNHLTDELRNALDPNSGLPRNLRLRPEQLQQMGIEKAVRHVADINKWRAEQKVAANKELSDKAMAVREYTENNPKGLRWVELKAGELPEQLPEGYQVHRYGENKFDLIGPDNKPIATGTKEEISKAFHRPDLEKQLRYEGDTMGHCVGGYCPDVLAGKSRIFSLRDAKGEPHVTVEVSPGMKRADASTDMFMNHVLPKEQTDAMVAKMIREGTFNRESLDAAVKAMPEYQAWAVGEDPSSIVQIKGKANQAPKEEYLPFVQDFVRNSPIGGQWGAVSDLENARLYRPGNKDFMTKEELFKIHSDVNHPLWNDVNDILQREIEGYRHGGVVRGRPGR